MACAEETSKFRDRMCHSYTVFELGSIYSCRVIGYLLGTMGVTRVVRRGHVLHPVAWLEAVHLGFNF